MSAQEIQNLIADLIKTADPYKDRIDVGFAIADCFSSSKEMVQYYNTDGYDPAKLELLKNKCAADYIRLEYTLAFLPEQHATYIARTKVYTLCRLAKKVDLKKYSQEDKLAFVSIYTRLKQLRQESLTCQFKFDVNELNQIEEKLERYS